MAKSGFAKEHLRSFIERLEEEKKALADDIREVYSEAKGSGFDTKVMRQVIRLRKMETADRQEQEAMRDIYMSALGRLADTPLGQAAMARAIPEKCRASAHVPPHDPETGEVHEDEIPEPATEAAAAVAAESDAPKGAHLDAFRDDRAEAGVKELAPDPAPANVSVGVTGGESAAPFNRDLPIPEFLRRRREHVPEPVS